MRRAVLAGCAVLTFLESPVKANIIELSTDGTLHFSSASGIESNAPVTDGGVIIILSNPRPGLN
jgi:hypothetical protein